MDKNRLDQALGTIRKRTSKSAVVAYLRDKEIPFSAKNWDDFIDEKIKPAHEKGLLTDHDIRELLRDAEDFGHQHVFLFEPSSENVAPQSLLKTSTVEKKLEKMGLTSLVDTVKIVELPAKTEIVDVHFDSVYLSIKFVERRVVILEEREKVGDATLVRKVKKTVRAVDIVNMFSSGLVEFRIGTCDGTQDYSAIVEDLWLQIEDLIPRKKFREKELVKVRRKFTVDPSDTIKSLVRVRMTQGVDGGGVKYAVVAGRPSGDILDRDNIVQGLISIAGSRKARPGATSVGFSKQTSGFPSRELGVSFLGNVNEFIVLLNCTRREHEYIRTQIEKYS